MMVRSLWETSSLISALLLLIATVTAAAEPKPVMRALSRSDTAARNIRTLTRFQLECVANGDMTHLNDYMAADMKIYASGGDGLLQLLGKPVQPPHIQHREDFRKQGRNALSSIVNQKRFIEDMVASGDTVIGRWRVEGKVTGSFLGVPGNGNSLSFEEIGIIHFDASGHMIDGWFRTDGATILYQLGLKPEDIKLPVAR